MEINMINEVYPLNNEAWLEWSEYRRLELRKRIGPMAEKKQQKLLTAYPPPIQQSIIDHSITNSYQGLFPPKQQQQSTRRTNIYDELTDTSWA